MPTTLVTYDLSQPGRDYETVSNVLQSLGTVDWLRPLQSVWIVVGPYGAEDIVTRLMQVAHSNDKVFAVDVTGQQMVWNNLSATHTQRLQSGVTNR